MKRLFVFTFLTLLCSPAFGQFDFGIKGGVNTSSITFENLEQNSSVADIIANNEFGYHAGAYVRVKVLGVYLQPEFIYTQMNSVLEVQGSNGSVEEVDFALSRFDIPVNLGFKIGPASVFGGPVLSYNLNNPSEILDLDYNGGTLGFQAGVGLTFGNFIMDVKYEGAFQALTEQVIVDGQAYDVDARTGQFILSLGYALF